jgi:N-acetylated-alpha-linked acidic dipeptidase
VSSSGDVIFDAPTAQLEPALTDDEKKLGVARPFNAYSGVGSAKGPLVYVNYGRMEDFQLLASMNISLSGCVCIARYGKIFRGSKASLAEKNGCHGLVIYSDPHDYGPKEGYPSYPDGWSLPVTGLQRGSVMILDGDPLTPLRPAISGVYRRTYEDALGDHKFPSIPVTPLSSSDAYHFLSIVSQNSKAPDEWQGGFNFTYYIGPGFNDENKEHLAYVEVNNYFSNKTIVDVVGTIYGTQEPDHPVLLGNHRDAWTFGGNDPSSGTATLMEVVQAVGMLRASGWRPGRTLMFCSWDAEEYGLIGSVEFAEDRTKQLLLNAVAYLNVDIAVSGDDFLIGRASPLLIPVIYAATKKVMSPNDPSVTVYDEWVKLDPDPSGKPIVFGLGAGSDFTPFLQNLGIPSSDYSYITSLNGSKFTGYLYPVYHSIHDTFEWVKKSVDYNFTHHLALGKVWLRSALQLTTTPIIPFGVVEYGEHLEELAKELNESTYSTLQQQDISLDFLFSSVDSFKSSAKKLQDAVDYVRSQNFNDTMNLKKWRVLNSKLIGVERSFLVPEGLPGRPFFKHTIYAPGKYNSYATSAFPGVTDSMFEEDWNEVKKQVSVAALGIRAAANVMMDTLDVAIYDRF